MRLWSDVIARLTAPVSVKVSVEVDSDTIADFVN